MLIQRGQTANFCCSKYLLFISKMPKMCAIRQLVLAPLSPLPIIVEHFSRSHRQCVNSY